MNSMAKLLFLVVAIIWVTSQVLGQAPGDHSNACRTGTNTRDDHIFPAEWRVLVDTFDYENLYDSSGFPSPVWLAGSNSWDQLSIGDCEWHVRSCELGSGSQNNWLFSQYISYGAANEVFFNVSFNFNECRQRQDCDMEYMTVHGYNRDGMASTTERMRTSNYQPLFGTAESSRLQQPPNIATQVDRNLSFTRPRNSEGLYLALQDEGTCGSVIRIIMYYVVCLGRVVDLVTYPEMSVPVVGSSDIIFDAECFPNAYNTTTLQVTASASTSTCTDRATGGARCECNGGYLISNDRRSCVACNAGTYRSLNDNTCLSCPVNTDISGVAAPVCNCTEGFYRNDAPEEGPEVDCTAPPSRCLSLEVMSSTDTTVTLRWRRPVTIGRSDFFYRVLHSDPDNIQGFITSNDNLVNDMSTVTYEVTGLVPYTSYLFRVTTHNGVSDQDPGSHLRRCEVSIRTMEGLPSQPTNVQQLCTVVVWQTPSETNGDISGYEIEFSPGQRRPLNPDITYYLTTANERNTDIQVRVRASTSAGFGDWTTLEDVGCTSGGGTCPPPSTCPTSQPCPTCPSLTSPTPCPTIPPATPCITVTCRTCPSCATCPTVEPVTCPSCPVITCPTSPPTCLPTCNSAGLRFELKGITYLNNSVVLVDDIGVNAEALLCITDNTDCCITVRRGEFYYPDETKVAINNVDQDFYRNRGDRVVRLHRRNGAQSPIGRYSCQIPDASGVDQTIYINIISNSSTACPTTSACPACPTCNDITQCPECPSNCPTTPLIPSDDPIITGMIEVSDSFVAALDSPVISNKLELVLEENLKKRQASSISIEIDVISGSTLIVIPKDKIKALIKGSSYTIQIKESTGTSFIFQYTEEIPQTMTTSSGNNNLVTYIIATAVVSIVFTLIITVGIMTCIMLYVYKKQKSTMSAKDILSKYHPNKDYPNSIEIAGKEEKF